MWSEHSLSRQRTQAVWNTGDSYRRHGGRQTWASTHKPRFTARAAVSYRSLTACGWARAAWGPASAWTTCHSSHTWGSSPRCGWPCGIPGEPSGWKTCHTKYTCSSSDLHINPNGHTVNQSDAQHEETHCTGMWQVGIKQNWLVTGTLHSRTVYLQPLRTTELYAATKASEANKPDLWLLTYTHTLYCLQLTHDTSSGGKKKSLLTLVPNLIQSLKKKTQEF